jgi:hypothetical protein
MSDLQRGVWVRTTSGAIIGTAAVIVIQFIGQDYIINNVPAQYYSLFFFGRVPWIAMMGGALALTGALATLRLDFRLDPLPILTRIGAIGLGVGVLVATIQQFIFQGLPFFFDFFVTLIINAGWYLFVAILPFWILTTILQYVLGFVHKPRSARSIMPPDLLAEIDHQAKR